MGDTTLKGRDGDFFLKEQSMLKIRSADFFSSIDIYRAFSIDIKEYTPDKPKLGVYDTHRDRETG